MTHLDELRALAEQMRSCATAFASQDDISPERASDTLNWYADELTELLGKVVVTDEMVEKSSRVYDQLCDAGWVRNDDMRAALESALGVTK